MKRRLLQAKDHLLCMPDMESLHGLTGRLYQASVAMELFFVQGRSACQGKQLPSLLER